MVTLRDRKRAASPAEDAAIPDVPKKKQTRAKKQQATQPISEDDDELIQAQQPPKQKRGRAAAKPKDSPIADEDEDEDDSQPKPQAKGKGKAKSAPANANTTKDDPAKTIFSAQSKYEKTDTMMADGQYAKSDKLIIPVDETCPLSSWRVFIDDDGIIYDASLNQTNSGKNNNKFYKRMLSLPDFEMISTDPIDSADTHQRQPVSDMDPLGPCR
jgi:poly [ADP-ribose] polymerase